MEKNVLVCRISLRILISPIPYLPPQGSVRSLLDDQTPENPLTWPERARIAMGAARGLRCLHDFVDPPVVHRDMKTANLLFTEDNRVR